MKRLLALLALLPLSAVAAPTCSISSPGLNFGSTSFIGPAGLSAQAPIDTTCDSAGLPATIGFADAGGALQVAGQSAVTNAQGAGMSFRLYQDPARTIPWGRDQGKGLTTTLPFHGAVYGSITCAGVGREIGRASCRERV